MTVRLDLLRHGETELGGGLRGSLDDALTELGWAQMHEAVQGQGPWDRIVSSPLQRCRLFARWWRCAGPPSPARRSSTWVGCQLQGGFNMNKMVLAASLVLAMGGGAQAQQTERAFPRAPSP